MPHGSLQFTPRQLLEAGRHAEAEGKLDLAAQFYRHLTDHFGLTSEAAEGRSRLTGIWAAAHHPQVWQSNGGTASSLAAEGKLAIGRSRRAKAIAKRDRYRLGRVLAAVVSGIGWLVVCGAFLGFAAGMAASFMPTAVARDLNLSYGLLLQLAAAALCGAVTVLCGHAARALFDQASATRELVAIERAKAGAEHS